MSVGISNVECEKIFVNEKSIKIVAKLCHGWHWPSHWGWNICLFPNGSDWQDNATQFWMSNFGPVATLAGMKIPLKTCPQHFLLCVPVQICKKPTNSPSVQIEFCIICINLLGVPGRWGKNFLWVNGNNSAFFDERKFWNTFEHTKRTPNWDKIEDCEIRLRADSSMQGWTEMNETLQTKSTHFNIFENATLSKICFQNVSTNADFHFFHLLTELRQLR